MTNLAVVGAGIGGCSAAYFARKYLPDSRVTIYDSQNRIGGRILTQNAVGLTMELGAAFFSSFNRTILGIAKAEQLKITPVERIDFAVWNGSEFVFRSNKNSFATALKLLEKHKLSLVRTLLLLREVRGQLSKLYNELFENPANIGEVFEATGLDKCYKKSFLELLIERGVSQAFIDEVVTPVTRIIYSQNADIGGFAGISSFIGVYSGVTYSFAEGNCILPVHLAEASNAIVKLRQKVDLIEKTRNGTYTVYASGEGTVFDDVIVAAPMDFAGIKFDGLSMNDWEPQPFQAVYKKVIRGAFDPAYFGLKSSADLPALVLTTKDAEPLTYFSFQKLTNGESLVTISSSEPLGNSVFEGVFKNGEVSVLDHYWKTAYPIFKPIAKLPLTSIDKRIIYVSALEPVVSSMETSALSAFNAVRLLFKE